MFTSLVTVMLGIKYCFLATSSLLSTQREDADWG